MPQLWRLRQSARSRRHRRQEKMMSSQRPRLSWQLPKPTWRWLNRRLELPFEVTLTFFSDRKRGLEIFKSNTLLYRHLEPATQECSALWIQDVHFCIRAIYLNETQKTTKRKGLPPVWQLPTCGKQWNPCECGSVCLRWTGARWSRTCSVYLWGPIPSSGISSKASRPSSQPLQSRTHRSHNLRVQVCQVATQVAASRQLTETCNMGHEFAHVWLFGWRSLTISNHDLLFTNIASEVGTVSFNLL